MKAHDFYRYKESAKALLKMAIPDDNTDGENVHCDALWENIAYNLETLCNEFEGKGYDISDVVSAYNEKKDAILDGIEASVNDGAMERGGEIWNRILTAIGHLNSPLIHRTGDCATETEKKPTGGVFNPDTRLTTDEVRAVFKKFEECGYIRAKDDGHYEWLKYGRKALFGYWLEQVAIHCGIKEHNGNTSRKPFEDLFEIHGTARNADQCPLPKGSEDINRIMSELRK